MKNARPILIRVIGTAAVFGVVFALAATLGVEGQTLGAGSDSTIAACDANGVTTSYSTAWDATDARYEVSDVTVSGIAPECDGSDLKVTLVSSTGASIGEGPGSVPDDALTVGDSSTTVTMSPQSSAAAVTGVHVVIAD